MSQVFSLIALFVMSFSFLHADELWNKAIDNYEKSKTYEPRSMTMIMEELKKDGSVDERNEVYLTMIKNSDGTKDTEILKVVKNGKDVTEEEKKKREKNKSNGNDKKNSFSLQLDFFDTTKQAAVVYKRLGEMPENVNDVSCIPYEFTYKRSDKESYVGTVWLSEQSGVPVKAEFTLNPLPSKVKKMSIAVDYGDFNGFSIVKKIAVYAHASFLVISKRIRSSMEFGY